MMMDGSKTVGTVGLAMFGSFSPDGSTYYVPHQGAMDALHAIDTTTLVRRDLPLPPSACVNAHAFVLGPDHINGVLVCEGDHVMIPGSVVFVNVQAFAITGSVQTLMFSDGAAWLPPL